MGLLGKLIKRQRDEDAEDLDFDDEMDDSADMSGEEDGPSGGILGKLRNRRRKGEPEDTDEAEEADQDEADQDEADQDEAVQDEDPGIAESSAAPEEDSTVQVVRLEGIPDVHPVGDSNPSMTPSQEQTGPAPGSEASAVPGTGQPGPGAQPAENSSPAEANTPVDQATATATEDDTTEDSSKTDGEDLALSLQDIFGEVEEVDESLRDLADFVEDTLAQDLADELREFLEELEARQKK